MIICYYTENEKITHCHDGGGKTYEELKTLSDEWNSKNTKKMHIVEVKENSLTAYLFNREFYFKFCPNCGAKMDKEG